MQSDLAVFLAHLPTMTAPQKDFVRAAWEHRIPQSWAAAASSAVYSAEDCGARAGDRQAARQAAATAVRDEEPISWAAEGAANELQAEHPSEPKKTRNNFFFLPMFGFSSRVELRAKRP